VGGSAETSEELGKGGPQDYSLLEEVMQVGEEELLPIRLIERIEESAVFLENEIERRGRGFEEVEKIVRQRKDLFASTPNIFPVQGWISSDYGSRVNPVTRKREIHQAIDIVAPWGTEVRASAQGKVVSAGWKSAYGLMIRMNDGHGYQTVYGHLSRIVVKEGQWVDKGEVIGRVGSTGHSTGPHLHFEVWSEAKTVDPLGLMVEPLGEVR
jgi:murein DD-endopeptidase MepM/ murein hydrolase activator NlpD